jgi:predicted aspartyl protease
MSTPTNTFRCAVEIGPRDGSRFQRVIAVAGSENIYSVLPSTLLEMLGVGTEWESRFTLPGGGWEMLPMAEVRMRINGEERTTICVYGKADGEPILGRHTLAAFGLAADHDEQKLVQADMFLS